MDGNEDGSGLGRFEAYQVEALYLDAESRTDAAEDRLEIYSDTWKRYLAVSSLGDDASTRELESLVQDFRQARTILYDLLGSHTERALLDKIYTEMTGGDPGSEDTVLGDAEQIKRHTEMVQQRVQTIDGAIGVLEFMIEQRK